MTLRLLALLAASVCLLSSAAAQQSHTPQVPSLAQQSSQGGGSMIHQSSEGASTNPYTVQAGYDLLDAGDARGAEATFLAVLRTEPSNLSALEGLAWAYAAAGDDKRAAATADARMALTPDDPTWRPHWLTLVSQVPSRREEALAVYRSLIARDPADLELRLRYAEVLSWTEGRVADAEAAYRRAVELDPSSRPARLGLARVLSWQGELDEAQALYDELLAEHSDLEALLGRARIARTRGDLLGARRLLEAAQAIAPQNDEIRQELVELERNELNRPARQSAAATLEVTADHTDAPDTAPAPRIGVKQTRSGESGGFTRQIVELRAELYPTPTTRLRLEPSWTWFAEEEGDSVNRVTLGLQLRQELPLGWYGALFYRPHLIEEESSVHDVGVEVGWRPADIPIQSRLGWRQRALADALPGFEAVAFLPSVGSEGQTVQSIRDGVQVREGFAGLTLFPIAGTYLFGEGTLGPTDDDNRRTSVSAGLGVDVVESAGVSSRFALFLRYDAFYLDYAEERELYYSPASAQVHSPALELRWRPSDASVVGAEGGWSFVPEGEDGFLAGGFFGFDVGDWLRIEGRLRSSNSPQYRVTSGVFGFSVRL